jgi:hypothetical protein
MAILTGENLLQSTVESTGVEINDLIFHTLSAKWQQMIDNGTYGNLAAGIAMSGFSTVINDATEISELTDIIKTNKALIVKQQTKGEVMTMLIYCQMPSTGASPLPESTMTA